MYRIPEDLNKIQINQNLDMKIAWVGSLKTRTLRNRILKKGFLENNIEVIDLTIPAEFTPYSSKIALGIGTAARAFTSLKKPLVLLESIDFLFISYPSQDIFPILYYLKLFNKKKTPIVFDPFISVFYSYTQDYRLLNPRSLIAKLIYQWEQISFRNSDIILAETNAMCDFFSKAYRVSRSKLKRAFLGADDSLFNPDRYPPKQTDEKTIVSFIGEFIPSQGIEYILKAAEILNPHKNIEFQLIGGLRKPLQIAKEFVESKRLNNVRLYAYIPLEQVPEKIADSDIQLGIFGKTPKAKMVISNKVVCAAAMKKPIITGYSNASAELFTHQENIWFTEFANPRALAESILQLHEDPSMRKKLGANARQVFLQNLTPKAVVKSILNEFKTR